MAVIILFQYILGGGGGYFLIILINFNIFFLEYGFLRFRFTIPEDFKDNFVEFVAQARQELLLYKTFKF